MSKMTSHKTVLVTGANRGMGLGYVRHYLREGWIVIATIRPHASAEELLWLRTDHPQLLRVSELDQADETSIIRWQHDAAARGYQFDLVICNAGVSLPTAFGEWSAELFDRHWRANVVGPALLAQAVAPRMRPGAVLANVSSGMGSVTLNIGAEGPLDAYAVTKAALNMLTRRLAEKLRAAGITVVAINPGWVRTAMGGPDAPAAVDEAIGQITRTLRDVGLKNSGSFLSATGEVLPW
ncbi:MAG: SDR family oxidoreductase [Candidatus Sumerlaeaceae bacterium]|nr:SDR family oxidoreductase [Candidatus Sumerlaeaceae bacterium]